MCITDDVYISELRRSGRFRGHRSVVEENTIDEAINVHDFNNDFAPVSYPMRQATGSNGNSKASEIFTGNLNRWSMKCQTDSKAANCGVFAMRHMKTYMGSTCDKFVCRLEVDGRKLTRNLNRLSVKYAAKILLSGCNIHSAKVRGLWNVK
ncbi:hypothetical protein Tco_0779655 [Tanacetum coccineum]